MTPIPKTPMIVEEELDSPNGGDGYWNFNTEAIFEGWYPVLRKAIWLLSKIYRLVNVSLPSQLIHVSSLEKSQSTVFDDLAHQIVHQTTLSLHLAASQIATKSSPADGQLFLIKHLLTLKQQIVAFDIEFVTPDITFDFSGVTNTFHELRDRGTLFDPRNLWRIMAGRALLPRVVENMLDAKVELDGRLRTVINDFTNGFAARMLAPVSEAAAAKRGFEPSTAVRAVREATEQELPGLRKKLDEYLDDVRTKETLVAAVREYVLEGYEAFYERWTREQRSKGTAQISTKGKGREDGVWDLETFGEWTAQVFGVRSGMVPGTDGGGGSDSRRMSPSLSRSGSGSV